MHAKFEFAGLQKDQANDETVFVTFGVKVFFLFFGGDSSIRQSAVERNASY
jgi:hypothetical protein